MVCFFVVAQVQQSSIDQLLWPQELTTHCLLEQILGEGRDIDGNIELDSLPKNVQISLLLQQLRDELEEIHKGGFNSSSDAFEACYGDLLQLCEERSLEIVEAHIMRAEVLDLSLITMEDEGGLASDIEDSLDYCEEILHDYDTQGHCRLEGMPNLYAVSLIAKLHTTRAVHLQYDAGCIMTMISHLHESVKAYETIRKYCGPSLELSRELAKTYQSLAEIFLEAAFDEDNVMLNAPEWIEVDEDDNPLVDELTYDPVLLSNAKRFSEAAVALSDSGKSPLRFRISCLRTRFAVYDKLGDIKRSISELCDIATLSINLPKKERYQEWVEACFELGRLHFTQGNYAAAAGNFGFAFGHLQKSSVPFCGEFLGLRHLEYGRSLLEVGSSYQAVHELGSAVDLLESEVNGDNGYENLSAKPAHIQAKALLELNMRAFQRPTYS